MRANAHRMPGAVPPDAGSPGPAALARLGAPVLSLPRLHPDIDVSAGAARAAALPARIALDLMDDGILVPEDWRGDGVRAMVGRGLGRWMNAEGKAPSIPFTAVLVDDFAHPQLGAGWWARDHIQARAQLTGDEPVPAIGILARNGRGYMVGATLERIAAMNKPLAATLYRAAEWCLQNTVSCLSPALALDVARMEMWMGEEDETAVLAEWELDDSEYDGVRRADFKACYPAWVLDDVLPDRAVLARFAAEDAPHRAMAAAALTALDAVEAVGKDGGVITSPAIATDMPYGLWWHTAASQDLMTRIWDDHFRYLLEGEEYVDALAVIPFHTEPTPSAAQAARKASALFSAIALTENLLEMLHAEPTDRR